MVEAKGYIPQCNFCGASVGDISERTNEQVNAIYQGGKFTTTHNDNKCPNARLKTH